MADPFGDHERKAAADAACGTCNLPKSEHHYNGAAYGVCGDFTPGQRRSAEQAAAYAAEERQLQQAQPVKAADLTLAERVRARIEFSIWKRDGKMLEQPRDQYAVDQDVEQTINEWSMTELLDAISMELEAKENGE